jgi:molybdate transport system substrate-binding protein
MKRRPALFLVAAALALPLAAQPPADAPLVAAASDLQFALAEVASAFEKATGQRVRLVMGSSGNFTRQILQGAPFELFFSADEEYVEQLSRAGATRDAGALYGIGRIALVVPTNSPLRADGSLGDLRAALAAGRVARFAIANPDHAPYGRRAEEALRRAGLWEAVKPRLVLGENVSQAAQFATSGNAQAGIVAYSLALSPAVASATRHALIPEDWHAPLRQRMVLTRKAGAGAQRFYHYVQAPEGREILRRHGFSLPGAP